MQELISRGRFIFSGAPNRLEVFKKVNKTTSSEISKKLGRGVNSILNDLKKLEDLELVLSLKDNQGDLIKKRGEKLYVKNPLVKHVPLNYFTDYIKSQKAIKKGIKDKKQRKNSLVINFPSENQTLDICKEGESQLYEFKRQGTEMQKLSKEISALLNTKSGGIIFYGVEDDGSITGTDKRKQEFDQSLHNSIRNNIAPAPSIKIKSQKILGYEILLILIDPWNKKDVYECNGRVYIRKGTNVFEAKTEEKKKLYKGQYID